MTAKDIYLSLLRKHVQREGLENLIVYLEKSDFFSAPASSQFHNAYPGGLVEHSLYVYRCLHDKMQSAVYKNVLTEENVALVALLHDIRKTNYYKQELRNTKVNGEWVQVPFYTVQDKIPYGTGGEKSVMMLESFLHLKADEKYAIRWQKGPYEGERAWSSFDAAVKKHPLVLAFFEAEMEASRMYRDPMPF